MKILVTGAGGFLGYHLAKALVGEGHDVTNYSRMKYGKLASLGVRQISGDLIDQEKISKALKGKEVVFHCAALPLMWGKYDWFYSTNYQGTKILLEESKKNGVNKFIYTSSPSVIFDGNDVEGGDESLPYPEHYLSFYAETKAKAEKLVLESHNPPHFLTCALRPHLIWGPNDPHLLPRVVELAKKGKLKRIGEGLNLVDMTFIDNAVHAHLLAMKGLKNGATMGGKAYFIGDDAPVNLWDFIDRVLEVHGVMSIKKKISLNWSYRLGSFFEMLYIFLNRYDEAPPMTRFVSLQLGKSHYFSHENAKKDFDYKPIINFRKAFERYATDLKQRS